MRSLFIIAFCLLGLSLSAQDIDYSSLTIPAELKENASSVVRYQEERYEVTSENQARKYYHRVVTLLNKDHHQENQLVAQYQSSLKITKFKVNVYDLLGREIDSSKRTDVEDVSAGGDSFDSDSRVRTVTVDVPSYPCTIEFIYEAKLKDFAMVAWMPRFTPVNYGQSCEYAQLLITVPNENKVHSYSNGLAEFKEGATTEGRAYEWKLENFPSRTYEAFAPSWAQNLPFVDTSLDHFEIDGQPGSFADWESFGAFKQRLYEGRDVLPAPLREEVQRTVAGLTDTKEKVVALYRLMQSRTRYVSIQQDIGGWQPFSATEVEENRWGDCKALSNYLGAMLGEVGIPTDIVNIYSGDVFFPMQDDYATSQFNHIILYVPEEDMYLECTSKDYPAGYLGSSTVDRRVLHFNKNGSRIATIPKRSAAENGRVRRVNVKLNEQGGAEVALHAGLYGDSQEMYRWLSNYTPDQNKQLEMLHRHGDLPDVTGSHYSLTVSPDEPVATLDYQTSLPNYSSRRGSRMFVNLNKFSDIAVEVPDKDTNRVYPIVQRANAFYVDSVYMSLPEGMEVESLGDAEVNYQHAAGEYRSKVEVSGNELVWSRTLKLEPIELPASEWDSFREFYLNISQAEGRRLVLKERRSR